MNYGYLEMYGAGINLAIKDFRKYAPKEKQILSDKKYRDQQDIFESARNYLFAPNWLELQLTMFGLNDVINIEYLRSHCLKGLTLNKNTSSEDTLEIIV